ncbi:MAG: DEAD/DEAH box helicase, partial [Candidatus Lokiarchaeota archaeon]|nr:DEAD/DEAH box helicase [Candidatus Lokiarchaeota archaeon]
MKMQTKNKINATITKLQKAPFYEKQIRHIEKIETREPEIGILKHNLDQRIMGWLNANNYQLYSHQTEAIDAILDDKNVIIVTPTASGKSLAYNIPILESVLNDLRSTFLYIFPQKALTQDQYAKLQNHFSDLNLEQKWIGIYDGDTNKYEKARIRRQSRLILTNPYGLHYYIAYRQLWSRFWRNLKYIIIDECHNYRGVFGSNFAQVVRRLRRILRTFNIDPLFILS